MGAHRTDLVKAEPAAVPEMVRPPAGLAEDLLATPPDARDISAELAAPPRRRLPWLTLCLAGGIVAVAAFSGGVWYQKNNGTTGGRTPAAAGGFGQRAGAGGYGQQGSRQAQQGAAGAGAGQGAEASGATTVGTVKVVDGGNVYLTDSQGDTVKITTGSSTKVKLSRNGRVSDLQPGDTVVVQGTRDSSGSVAATQVTEGGGTIGGFGGFGSRSAGGSGGGQAQAGG